MRVSVLLIVPAVKIARPTPFLRAEHNGGRVVAFYNAAIVENFIANLLHCGADRMDISMRAVPDAMLVIHKIVPHAAIGRTAPPIGEMTQPRLLKTRDRRKIRVSRIVCGNEPGGMRVGVC